MVSDLIFSFLQTGGYSEDMIPTVSVVCGPNDLIRLYIFLNFPGKSLLMRDDS